MRNALSPHCKRIIRQQIATGQIASESEGIRHSPPVVDSVRRTAGPQGSFFSGREDLEELLLEGLVRGQGAPMTAARKKWIYEKTLREA